LTRTGVENIQAAFAKAQAEGRAAFMPYQMLGHPTLDASPRIIQALAAAGADLFELGLPFSDPLADGPVIQAAAQRALDNGVTIERCLAMVSELRAAIPETPFCLMGYANPMLAYGLERFVAEAAAAGADGLIVPDLPPDEPEAEELIALCRQHGLATIFLLAPTSTPERISLGVARSQGFVYLVSVAGITGARDRLPDDLSAFVQRVRTEAQRQSPAAPIYLAVGFGISTPALAAQVAQIADGVIVGSALVKLAGQGGDDPAPAVAGFAADLAQAARRTSDSLGGFAQTGLS
jgi:tryptophan synthase alpha chain